MSEFSIVFQEKEKKIPYTTEFEEFKKSFSKAFEVDENNNYEFYYKDYDDDRCDLNEDSLPSNFKDAQLYKILAEFNEVEAKNSKEKPDNTQDSLSSLKGQIENLSTNFDNPENESIYLSDKKPNNSSINVFILSQSNKKDNQIIEKEEIENIFLNNNNESYTCTECSSNIEINSLNEQNNNISFKCPVHGNKEMKIKDYLYKMKKNTYLYSKCNSCKKEQNTINNNKIFNYCTNCKLILCHECILNHDNNHIIIKNNETMTKCSLHPSNNNKSYCLDCNCHLCKECIKHRKHMRHKKQNIEEIEPSNEEINSFINIINKYKEKMTNTEIEKQNKLFEIKNKYNEEWNIEKKEYENKIIKNKTDLEEELKRIENSYNYEINEIKKKYEKEIYQKRMNLQNKKKELNDDYKKKK